MLKKILLTIAAAVALFVVAAIALLVFVDVNRFKPQIEAYVSENYQRTLKIDGDLSLSVFPNIALALPKASVSGRGGKGEFASLSGARVSVALMALLRGEIRADTLRIDGLRARIERNADGSLSIDDLTAPRGAAKPGAAKPSGPATESRGAAPMAIAIGGIALTDAALTFDDRQAKNTITVSQLNLKTGAFATKGTTPVSLDARFSMTNPKGAGELSVKADLSTDLAARRFGARELDAMLKTVLDGQSIELRIRAPELTGNADAVSSPRVTLDASVVQGARKVVAALATPLRADLKAGIFELAQLTGDVSVDDPALPKKSLKLTTRASVNVNTKAQTVAARYQTKLEDTTLKATVDVKGFAKPAIRFDLEADKLDLDALMPVAAGAAAGGKPPAASEKPAGASGQASAAAAARVPIDLSALNALDLAGQARIGALKVQGMHATAVAATLKAAGGRLDIAPLSAALYGGKLDAKANALAKGNRLGLTAALAGIQINPLLKDAAGKDILEGTGNVNVDVTTAGADVEAFKRALAGKASVVLKNGAIKGINLGEMLRKAKSAIAGGKQQSQAADTTQRTDFTEMSVSFAIANGVASSKDLDLKSPLLRVGGEGKADLPASTLDYTVRVSVVGTSTGQSGRELEELRGVTIPVHLSGPFAGPQWQVDWNAVAKDALKSKAGEKLKARLEPEKEKLKARRDEAKDKLREQLKGLFK